MKKFFICLGLAAIMLAPSCENDPTSDILNGSENNTESGIENGVENGEGEAVAYLSVGINNADTNANTNTNTNTTADSRISVGEENEESRIPLYWSKGDKLVINRTIETLAIGEEFDGKDMAEFGLSPEALSQITYPITLLYPATSMTSSSTKHFYIDTEQEYLQGHLSNGYGILMGKAEKVGDGISMEHMCGYMRVSLTGSATVKKVMLRTVGHEPISGYFKHNETSTEIGMTTYMDKGFADGHYSSPVITIDCGEEGVTLSGKATDFYFALPAGTYSKGFVLHVLDNNNKQHRVKVYGNGKTITAGNMLKMPALQVNCTKEWGIFDGNELASFGRTLEKNVWLGVDETTIYLRNDIDMENETFTDLPYDTSHRAFITFRADEGYNNDKIAVIDGKKSEAENYVIYNLRKETTTDGGMLFARIPEYLTVQNITLGRVIDDPTTEEMEADCVFTLNPNEDDYTYTGVFSYVVLGTVKNCVNNASVIGTVTTCKGLKFGIFAGNSDSSTGTVDGCINNGSIIMDATNGTTENFVSGIAGINYGIIKNCTNNGTIKVTGSGASKGIHIAGIVGCCAGESETTNCCNKGAISITGATTDVYAGGVSGYAKRPLSGCSNYGTVTTTDTGSKLYLGGILGHLTSAGSISDCTNYSTGTVTANNPAGTPYVGGVLGSAENEVPNCHNQGNITINSSKKSVRFGGTVGVAEMAVTNCSNSGNVSVLTPAAGGRMGGVIGDAYGLVTNCTNTGNITLDKAVDTTHVGGVLGTNNYIVKDDSDAITSSQLMTGCVNGIENNTDKGKINITCKTSSNIYSGGICGYSYQIINGDSASTEINAINYAPISVDGSATTDVGGVWGYAMTKSILVGYENYGNITITNAGSSSYSYCGGVGGNCAKDNKTYNCDNEGDLTLHFPKGKVRAGLIMPYLATASNCDAVGTIHIKSGTTAASEVGGLGGFSNNSTKSNCTLNGKIKNEATGVLVGGLLGSANGSTYSNCTMKIEIESSDTANTAFAVTRAASAGYTVTLGASKKPLKINKASKFNGITASSIDVFSNYEESGFINFCNTHATYQLSVARNNISFVD